MSAPRLRARAPHRAVWDDRRGDDWARPPHLARRTAGQTADSVPVARSWPDVESGATAALRRSVTVGRTGKSGRSWVECSVCHHWRDDQRENRANYWLPVLVLDVLLLIYRA